MRMQVRLTAAGIPRTFEEFVAALRLDLQQNPIDPRTVLFSVCHYSRTIGMYSHANQVPLTCQAFATAAYSILVAAQPFSAFEPPEFRAWDDGLTQAYVTNAENVIEGWQRIADPNIQRDLAKLSILRLVAESGLYQQEVIYKVANALVLVGFKRFGRLPIASEIIENIFQDQLRVSAFDFYILVYGFWARIAGQPHFNIPDLMGKIKRPDRFLHLAETLCSELSMSPDDFSQGNLNTNLETISPKFRGSAYFSLKPLIALGQKNYTCVAHPFLRAHVTSKFVQKSLALAREANPGANGSTELSDFMGKVRFEGFFKELCDVFIPKENHISEFKFLPGQDSADRMIFEHVNGRRVCTLVQLKLKAMPKAVHFAESWQAISDDFAKAFSDCIFKSISFLHQMEKARQSEQLVEGTEARTARILESDDFLFLGVVPDLPPIFSICYAREAIVARVNDKISRKPQLQTWYRNKFPDGPKWHIFDLTEFQYFLNLPRGTLVSKEITEYISQARVDDDPFDAEGHMTPTFKNFLIGRYGTAGADGVRRIPLDKTLQRVMTDLSKDMNYFLFKPFWQRWYRITFNFTREVFHRLGDRIQSS